MLKGYVIHCQLGAGRPLLRLQRRWEESREGIDAPSCCELRRCLRLQRVPYNTIYNGFQGSAEEIPGTDPLVAPPPGLGPYTPWSIHVTLAGLPSRLLLGAHNAVN